MELKNLQIKLRDGIEKHKFPLIVLAIGIVLMLLPRSVNHTGEEQPAQQVTTEGSCVEERLEKILRKIKGAGEVSVMLMEASGEEIIYQTDTSLANDSNKTDTVTVTDADRNECGLVRKVIAPKYCGAIVVCSGADDPQIRLAIVEAVCGITGLGADRISVLKMK